MNRLTIFNGEVDLSLQLENYIDGSHHVIFNMLTQLDVGYYKPISSLYLDVATPAPAISEMKIESSEGLISITDKTRGLTQSGFVSWEKEIKNHKKTVKHGKELYWYSISIDQADVHLNGVNLVFSDDIDLQEEYPDIMERLPEGKASFIGYHQATRNHILTYLRNKGKNVKGLNDRTKLLDQFDLHDHEEVKQASKFLTLSKIFGNESDQIDDKWDVRAKAFYQKYTEAIDLNFLSLDLDDDGKIDASEKQAIQFIRITRQ